MSFEEQRPDDHDEDSCEEHKDRDPVDPMHIAHPGTARCVRVPFFDIQVFFNLSPYAHEIIFFTRWPGLQI